MELRFYQLLLTGLLIVPIEVDAVAETSRDFNPMKEEKLHIVDSDNVDGYCAKLRLSADKHRRHQKHRRHISDNDAYIDMLNDAVNDESPIVRQNVEEGGRAPDENGQCCYGRKDHCSVPYEDTLCYCDSFCNRKETLDCCPDYQSYCVGSDVSFKPTESQSNENDDALIEQGPAVADSVETGHQEASEPLERLQKCLHENLVYNLGELLQIDCNECVCVTTSDEVKWECTTKQCAVKEMQIEDINADDLGWQAESYPEFVDKTVNELITEKLGTRLPSDKSAGMSNVKLSTNDKLPEQFDARNNWSGLISTPLNQGNCGASWAFSTAGVAADRLAIHSRGKIVVRLSAQQLVSCIGNHQHGQTGCRSVSFDRGWWFVRKTGLVSDECYPFTSGVLGDPGRCLLPRTNTQLSSATCPSSVAIKSPLTATVYRGSPPYKVQPQEEDMMREIMLNGPVQAMMIAKDDFYAYKSGVYRSSIVDNDHSDNNKRIHSVKIIGWGTDYSTGTALKYWLCANSWGENWGEKGYFRIARGANESAIETLVVGVWMRASGKHHHPHHLQRGEDKQRALEGDNVGQDFDEQRRRRLY